MIQTLTELNPASRQELEDRTGLSVDDILLAFSEAEDIDLLLEANDELTAKLNRIKELKPDPDGYVSILNLLSTTCGAYLVLIGIPGGLGLVGFGLCGTILVSGFGQRLDRLREWIGDV